jgi:hypothetical protein
MFKKTFPLTQGEVDMENGVVYFGDGNWGIVPEGCYNGNSSGIIETWNATNHVWMMELVAQGNYSIYPVDVNGNVFYPATTNNRSKSN